MNPKKVLTGAKRARKFRAAHHTTADLRKLADKKITTRKLQAHHIQACAGRRESSRQGSQRIRDTINECCRKVRLPALTLKLMRGDAPGSSVLLLRNTTLLHN